MRPAPNATTSAPCEPGWPARPAPAPAPVQAPAPAPATSSVAEPVKIPMPEVVGMNLQAAQDLIQTVFFSRSVQILDRDCLVVGQSPTAGELIGEGDAVLSVVKIGEAGLATISATTDRRHARPVRPSRRPRGPGCVRVDCPLRSAWVESSRASRLITFGTEARSRAATRDGRGETRSPVVPEPSWPWMPWTLRRRTAAPGRPVSLGSSARPTANAPDCARVVLDVVVAERCKQPPLPLPAQIARRRANAPSTALLRYTQSLHFRMQFSPRTGQDGTAGRIGGSPPSGRAVGVDVGLSFGPSRVRSPPYPTIHASILPGQSP